jgi:hypothetical protein
MAEPKQNSYHHMQAGADTGAQLNVDLPPIDAKAPAGPDSKRPVAPAGQNPNQSGEIDWSSMLQPATHDNYMNPVFPSSMAPGNENMHSQVENADRKYYPAATSSHQENGGLNGLYLASTSLGGDGTLGSHPIWNFNISQIDSLQSKADRIIDFCFPSGIQELSRHQDNNTDLKECLSADNVKHFLQLWPNYHAHWPLLHIPTFDFCNAYDGLALAICCIGAVYSDRVSPSQVRRLVSLANAALRRTSRIFKILEHPPIDDTPELLLSSDIEEMQSLVLFHCLGVWHGDPSQRAGAQEAISIFARFARRFGLLSPCGSERPDSYSPFHHMSPAVPITFESWDWLKWVEQEKRSRLVFLFYLFDSAQVLYCNREPHFNPQTVLLPLPCDDAAWEAQTAQQCAEALGLFGKGIQANVNISGSRRVRQLELNYALSALQSPVVDFRPGTTNVIGKFILIHALLEQIWLAQRQLHRDKMDRALDAEGDSFTAGSIYNPLSRDSCDAEAGHRPSANDFDADFNLVPAMFTADSSPS